MRLLLVAVGRMKSGPETDLADRYQDRAAKAGKSLGFRGVDVVVLDESRSTDSAQRKADEASAILKIAAGRIIALDERGKTIASEAFASRLGQWKDSGEDATTFVIGGADGLAATIRDKADLVISFGAMTWPHQLVRVMALEQIYRAVTILSGHPYHRA